MLVSCMIEELKMRRHFLENNSISTIYFGGGTPSVLSQKELYDIFNAIGLNYAIEPDTEITMEANPDDITLEKLKIWRSCGINRLSIGVQTFNLRSLRFLNRSHDARQAKTGIKTAKEAGFKNISCDLMFGLPNSSPEEWHNDLREVIKLKIQHLSVYGLTIEDKTVFGRWLKKGRLPRQNDDSMAHEYEYAVKLLIDSGFDHYEVSSFSKPGYTSRHNSNYWRQIAYLGIGPGAHSLKMPNRYFNRRNNNYYIKSILNGVLPCNYEKLNAVQIINEHILTRIRTNIGISTEWINQQLNINFSQIKEPILEECFRNNLLFEEENLLKTTSKGMLLADELTLQLSIDEFQLNKIQ